MDKIFIRDIKIRGIIGINASEREIEQEMIINIALFADLHDVGHTDEIQYSIDYGEIARRARGLAETAKRFTVEGLAEDIARMCLEHPRVQKVQVSVEKPDAIPFASSAGTEIERARKGE